MILSPTCCKWNKLNDEVRQRMKRLIERFKMCITLSTSTSTAAILTQDRPVKKNKNKKQTQKSCRVQVFSYLFLTLFIIYCSLRCDSQKHPISGVQASSSQQQPQQHQNGAVTPPGMVAQQRAQRPLDRPSLNLVTPKSQNLSSPAEIPEGAADWFMMGGGDLNTDEARPSASFSSDLNGKSSNSSFKSTRRMAEVKHRKNSNRGASNKTIFDDEHSDSSDSNETFDDIEENASSMAGTQKEPECASHGRYYCTFKEDYPLKLVTEVTKYYKWPLEKLFRDLHAQIMPKLASDSSGNLVCDSITRVVRPGWARNTNDRWLVVINTDNYHQYVTEVVCQYGTNSRCNFIPPCYYSSCQQRYNTQKLLVIDPTNPYRGPFLSEFLFPSCCVCYVPSTSEAFQDKYRSSPATIYQRTMQQEAASNLNPPQFRSPQINLIEEAFSSASNVGGLVDSARVPASSASNAAGQLGAISASAPPAGCATCNAGGSGGQANKPSQNLALGPGEIRRGGEQYQQRQDHSPERSEARQARQRDLGDEPYRNSPNEFSSFPRLGLADSVADHRAVSKE